MYHEVSPREAMAERYTVPMDNFREQLRYLRDNGYQTISLREYITNLECHGSNEGKKIILSFDDNNLSHYVTAMPLLAEFGFSATFFIVSGFIDTQKDFMTSEQIREMERSGMSIESHSHTHRFLSDLRDSDLRNELETSKRVLEGLLNCPVEFISCPGGRYSKRVLETALDAGYRGVCTSAPGLNMAVGDQVSTTFQRFLVSSDTPIEMFIKIARGDCEFVRNQVRQHRLKTAAKRLLGNRLYHGLWQHLRRDM